MNCIARVAEEKDKQWIAEVASIRMLCEEVMRPELVDPERISYLVDKTVSEGNCFVAEKDGELIGVIAGLIVPNLYNPAILVLTELFWYVLPDNRKSRAGFLLFDMFNKRGEETANEATLSLLLDSSEININSLEKRKFKLKEFAFSRVF